MIMMVKKGTIFVRYVYATEKGMEHLAILEQITDDILIQRIPKEVGMPPMPPIDFVRKHWRDGELRV